MDDAADLNTKPADASNPFVSVPVEVVVSVGKARPLIRDLVSLGENAVLTLDKRVEDPVDLYVGDRLVARGQLEELEGDQAGQLAVRLTEIADLQSGLG
ncbi:FliM/FliN family flagellar motor C-terminal domain-containing protein [Leisingera daeponensis]|uniref:Flagellar motor switch protein FliN n=1 Tax=Leisingera daeponensis TaxID=405746 RepID=A0ABS7NFX7_9RHOB|nr:FliM/FliN family flagellar motor C-terminal domain-containing protein [Leisingera daeponensis]MBY6056923.1 FliM/FliN family flagellar motor C-terminal domain-containing protein [Leisingera daeponensis]MBY6140108.1 FliM/FliN family flagellar motor C-terminal domain-containing protein [Leisingera daeponensis]